MVGSPVLMSDYASLIIHLIINKHDGAQYNNVGYSGVCTQSVGLQKIREVDKHGQLHWRLWPPEIRRLGSIPARSCIGLCQATVLELKVAHIVWHGQQVDIIALHAAFIILSGHAYKADNETLLPSFRAQCWQSIRQVS